MIVPPADTVQLYVLQPFSGVLYTTVSVSTQAGVGPVTTGVGNGLMVTTVVQVEILPHASVTVHVIVDAPTLNVPLASVPVPLLVVAPVTW
jgi:hypothetical protein